MDRRKTTERQDDRQDKTRQDKITHKIRDKDRTRHKRVDRGAKPASHVSVEEQDSTAKGIFTHFGKLWP